MAESLPVVAGVQADAQAAVAEGVHGGRPETGGAAACGDSADGGWAGGGWAGGGSAGDEPAVAALEEAGGRAQAL